MAEFLFVYSRMKTGDLKSEIKVEAREMNTKEPYREVSAGYLFLPKGAEGMDGILRNIQVRITVQVPEKKLQHEDYRRL